jgi:hypothetical protein
MGDDSGGFFVGEIEERSLHFAGRRVHPATPSGVNRK